MSSIKVNPETDQFAPVQEHTAVPNTTSDGGAKFKQFLGGAVNIAGQLASSAAGAQSFGLGPLVGNLASRRAGAAHAAVPQLANLTGSLRRWSRDA